MKYILAFLLISFSVFGQSNLGVTYNTGTKVVSPSGLSLVTSTASADPTTALGLVTKQYADTKWPRTTFTTGNILGTSIDAGSAASTWANAWPSIFCTSNSLTQNRLAYSSALPADYWWQASGGFTITNAGNIAIAPTIASSQNWAIGSGAFNFIRTVDCSGGATAAPLTYLKAAYQSLLVYLTTPTKTLASAASTSGTWTTYSQYGGGKKATNSAATLTFTNIAGSVVYVGYIGTVTATNDFGAISVAVDGTNYGSFSSLGAYGNRSVIAGSVDASLPAYVGPNTNSFIWTTPYVARITLSGRTAHTVVVTASGATPTSPSAVLWVTGNGQAFGSNTGPLVLASDTLRQLTWTAPGSDVTAGYANGVIRDTVELLRGDGLPIAYIPSSEFYNPANNADGVHPNNAGHVQIASAAQSVMERPMPYVLGQNFAGRLSEGTTVGPQPSTAGALRMSQGEEIRWRNSGGFDGVRLTNIATGLAIYAPNSTGASERSYAFYGDRFPMAAWDFGSFNASSPVGFNQTVTTAMAANNAVLSSQTLTVNNSSTGGYVANKTDVTLTANGSGANYLWEGTVGGRDIFRVTDAGRLLVDTATSGTGTSSRFGLGSVNSETVVIQYGTSGTDKALTIGGASINATINSSGANGNLAINSAGTSVNIGGALSVAEATTMGAGETHKYNAISGNTTLSTSYSTVFVDDSGGSLSVTFPLATTAGQQFTVKKTTGGNVTTLARTGADVFSTPDNTAATSYTLGLNESTTWMSTGANVWQMIGRTPMNSLWVTSTGVGGLVTSGGATNIASISVPAGEWNIQGLVTFTMTAVTASSFISSTGTNSGALSNFGQLPMTTAALTSNLGWPAPTWRYTFTTPTTVYLVARSTFTGTSVSCTGTITAIPIR